MPLREENQIIEKKYAAVQFGRMTEPERVLVAYSILLKIHVITGWTIPASDEFMDILVGQFQKKLDENYEKLNAEEIEYAFRNRGLQIKDWGKSLNLTMIDEVMLPYLQNRFDLSHVEETLMAKFAGRLDEKKEVTPEEWEEWLIDLPNYPFEYLPGSAYDYLVRQGVIILTNGEKHALMEKAVGYLLAHLPPGSKDLVAFHTMQDEGVYSAEVTATLVTISKRFALKNYFIKNEQHTPESYLPRL